ncbi:arsenate reductase [Parablastomonas sp. CN1-191]|uniref:arsenate reductase n=1 Tax=Parablastomonas sp. CN1-191 TaxID=3400908 RepID=UPI003BF7DB27
MTVTVYGIPNCDTVKKARAWLDLSGISYTFHDYKKAGADADKLRDWARVAGWEPLLNRAGTTFRKLPESEREGLNETRAITLMAAHPSAIRRPVVEHPGGLLVGFDAAAWGAALR